MKKLTRNNLLILSLFILGVSFFLRVYKINKNFLFVYDQGRDALKIQEVLKGDLTFIGPTTGIPGFFLGPFFYYLILPFYWLGGGDPLAPILFLIIIDVLGILITGLMVKKKSGWLAFLISLVLLAVNFSHIKHSRWLSNPNPILFLSPLYFFLLTLFLEKKKIGPKKDKLLLILGFLLGLLLQTELANAVFFIPATILALAVNFLTRKKRLSFFQIVEFSTGFLTTLLPLILFNLKNNFLMLTSLKNYFSQPGGQVAWAEVLKSRPRVYQQILTFSFSPKNSWFLSLSLVLIFLYLLKKKFWQDSLLLVLGLWLFLPLILMLFYTANQGAIWDYYLISQPIPLIMLFSLLLADFVKYNRWLGGMVIILSIVFLTVFNLKEWFILQLPASNRISLGTMKEAVDLVYQEADGHPFNVEVFVPNLLPLAYDYLFSWYGLKKYDYQPTSPEQREKLLFLIMEPGQEYDQGEQYWRNWWYKQRQHSGKIIDSFSVGDIDIQIRQRLSL